MGRRRHHPVPDPSRGPPESHVHRVRRRGLQRAELSVQSGFDRRLGILSIDVDGMDYHILEALGEWRPSILIVEYNAVFGPEREVTVPYEAEFTRFAKHSSGLYCGASLSAFVVLLEGRGYSLTGVNSAG